MPDDTPSTALELAALSKSLADDTFHLPLAMCGALTSTLTSMALSGSSVRMNPFFPFAAFCASSERGDGDIMAGRV